VKEYLSNYPGLKKEDYPKFEDFDHDNGKSKYESLFAECVRYPVLRWNLHGHRVIFLHKTDHFLNLCGGAMA
jgi:hypothetical protein